MESRVAFDGSYVAVRRPGRSNEGIVLKENGFTPLQVIALDSLDREVWINPSTLLTCRIQPDTLGYFISASGDTVSPLNNLRYDDARAGRFSLLGRYVQPGHTIPAIVEAVQMNDTTKRGKDTV